MIHLMKESWSSWDLAGPRIKEATVTLPHCCGRLYNLDPVMLDVSISVGNPISTFKKTRKIVPHNRPHATNLLVQGVGCCKMAASDWRIETGLDQAVMTELIWGVCTQG